MRMQTVECVRILRRARAPRGFGGLREAIEPRMKFVERLAVAALAFLDAIHQPAQKVFDGPLVHRSAGAVVQIFVQGIVREMSAAPA